MIFTLFGMLAAFVLAFLLACWDPIWGCKTSLQSGLDAILNKD